MQLFIEALLVTTLMTGHFCQTIVIDNSTLTSPCNTGARSAVDSYSITGTIGDNITAALIQNWQTVVFVKVLRRTSQYYVTICELVMGLRTCQPYSSITCDCLYNTTTDQARFTVSAPVQADDSNAVINVQWGHPGGTLYSNKNYTFPEIYDVNATNLALTVAGVKGNLPSGSCSFNLTLNKSSNLELCCLNTGKDCYPHISFNRIVVTNNTCVRYPTSQLATDGVTGNLVLSYYVCDQNDRRQGSSCTVTSELDVTPTTTESSSSSSNVTDAGTATTESSSSSSHMPDASSTTTESSSSWSHTHTTAPTSTPPDDNKCKTICPAVIVPVAVVIIACVVIAVCCYKKKKKSKGVSNHGTNGNGDHTGEHDKKDRYNAEHRNQAYDGTRTSPSEVTIDDVKTTKYENIQQHNKAHEKDSNKPISDRTNDDNASQSVPGNPRQLPPIKGTHTHGQLHRPAGSRPASVETTSATAVKL